MLAALDPAPRPATRPTRPVSLPTAWLLLAGLFVGEVLALTVRFDATALAQGSSLPARLAATTPDLLRIAICVSLAVIALCAWRFRSRPRGFEGDPGLVPGFWPWLPLHLASFGLLWSLSPRVFAGPAPPTGPGLLAWFVAASSTALFGAAAAVAPRFWAGLLRRAWDVLLAGVVIGLCAWGVGKLAFAGWESTATPTYWASSLLLRLLYTDVVADPDSHVLGTPTFRVMIAPACSGYEGIALVSVYLSAYLALFGRELNFPRALWLLPIGAMAAWSLNVVRIATLIAIGDSVSPELALGGFHSQAGWLAFNLVALGLAFVAHRSKVFAKDPTPSSRSLDPTAAHLAPLLGVLLTGMIVEAFTTSSAARYSLRVLVGAAVLAYCWRSIDGLGRRSLVEERTTGRAGVWWALAAGVAVFAVWVGLGPVSSAPRGASDPRESLAGLPAWAVVAWIGVRLLGSVVVTPVVEEVAFRGYLLRRFVSADFRMVSCRQFSLPAIVLSSVLFGLLHDRWLAGTVAGMAYALVYARRGRIGDAVLAHAVTNGLIGVAALATGDWRIWS